MPRAGPDKLAPAWLARARARGWVAAAAPGSTVATTVGKPRLCSTVAAADAEGRSSRRVEEDERRDGGPREAPPPESVRRHDGGSRALEQSRAARPPPRRPAPPWSEQPPPCRLAQAGHGAARPP